VSIHNKEINMRTALALLLAFTCTAAWALDQTPSPKGARVYFVEPKNGAVITGPVHVVFGIKGMKVAPAGTQAPDTGHHHLLIDIAQPADHTLPLPANDNIRHFGKGQTETTIDLAPGKHTLQLVFADYRHVPFKPNVASRRITITVK
jgi:hypothetical protein